MGKALLQYLGKFILGHFKDVATMKTPVVLRQFVIFLLNHSKMFPHQFKLKLGSFF